MSRTTDNRPVENVSAPDRSQSAKSPVSPLSIAVLIPCRDEAVAIERVVTDFATALPTATIYVYDNASTDMTAAIASAAGAVVRTESAPGKGNVIRRMFADIEADIYLLVDGDDTYDASAAPDLISRLLEGPFDMVTAARITDVEAAYRPGHRFGNRLLTTLVSSMFGQNVADMLSGYRAFSRRFVKSFPALSQGFETETELTIHALQLRMPVGEIEAPYKERPTGSESKLSTYADGFRILWMIVLLFKELRPLAFFGTWFALLAGLSLVMAWPVFVEFFETGLVPRLPTAVAATGAMLLAFLAMTCGLILDSVARGRQETKRMTYLSLESPPTADNAFRRR